MGEATNGKRFNGMMKDSGYIYNPTTTNDNDHSDDNDNDDDRANCGVWKCKPRSMRFLANMSVFTGVYSFSGLLTSTLSSYVNSQVTTLERHFGFNSAQTGLIMAANDVGFLVVVLFVSYIAAKMHIPRGLGFVTILFGISGIVCAVPYFMFGAPSPSSSGVKGNVTEGIMTSARSANRFTGQLCDGINASSNCDVTATSSSNASMVGTGGLGYSHARANAGAALVVIVLGMALQGIAKTPRSAFTTTYVDANVEKTKTGFYMGIIIAIGIMGPALAFAVGGFFTRIYVTLEATDMHPRHPKWIGAWWLGYIIFGVAACIFAIPLFCFPRRMRTIKRTEKQKEAEAKIQPTMIIDTVKNFLFALVRLWTNPVYMSIVLSACSMLFAVAGAQSFTPKYIENQFSFPAWKANMAMAGMMLGTACMGTFLGGWMTRRFKMGPLLSLKFTLITQVAALACGGIMIFFRCDQPHLYNSPGPRATSFTSLPGCHGDCACDDDDYFPVCGDDGRTFFSPCHAGCLQTINTGYTNCTCIGGGTATAGMCDYGCHMFIPFMLFMCLGALLSTLSIIPKLILYIRVVEERDKPLALGYSSFMTSLTGWMLGPIVFGKLIDDICIQWEKDHSCTGGGSCRLYDNDTFRMKLYGYQLLFRGFGVALIIAAYVLAKVRKVFDGRDGANFGSLHVEMNLVNGETDECAEKRKPVVKN